MKKLRAAEQAGTDQLSSESLAGAPGSSFKGSFQWAIAYRLLVAQRKLYSGNFDIQLREGKRTVVHS